MLFLVSSCVAVISMGVFTFVVRATRTAVHAFFSGWLQFTSTLHETESIVMQPKYYYIGGYAQVPPLSSQTPLHVAESFLKT